MQLIASAIILILASLFISAPTPADAQEACEYYRVKRGDTLKKISVRAYGYDNFRAIYRANRSEVGRNPNRISIGITLKLPCEDGSLPNEKVAEATDFSFVTANGYLPYTDESLTGQGLFTQLVSTAMMRAAPKKPVDVIFVNDWSAHLEALLPRQAFDASFPWTRPGCETQGELTRVELYACQNYVYSDPFYEIVDGFFARSGTGFESITDFSRLAGARICRPEGYPTGHLEEQGLMPPEITLVQPVTAHDCFDQLMHGKVDVVALDTRAGSIAMSDLGLKGQVVENPHLFSIQPLRVVLHKDNPKSAELIADLNTGLKTMLETGEWHSIVSEGLKEQADLVN